MTTSTGLYSSPRGVEDFRVIEVDEDKLFYSMEHLRTPMSTSPSSLQVIPPISHVLAPEPHHAAEADDDDECSNELPPPLRCLSVSTRSSIAADHDGDDACCDSSSVSSVSLDDFQEDALDNAYATPKPVPRQQQAPVHKRCIFGSYWEKKGGRPHNQRLLSTCQEESSVTARMDITKRNNNNKGFSAGEDSYEGVLEKNEAPRTTTTTNARHNSNTTPTSGERRRLWDNRYVSQYQSEPSLCQVAAMLAPAETLRKTHSTPVVGLKHTSTDGSGRRPSCMRQCRFSGSTRRASTLSASNHSHTETTVVSFSDHVEVKYLKTNTESFASPGWSKYFM